MNLMLQEEQSVMQNICLRLIKNSMTINFYWKKAETMDLHLINELSNKKIHQSSHGTACHFWDNNKTPSKQPFVGSVLATGCLVSFEYGYGYNSQYTLRQCVLHKHLLCDKFRRGITFQTLARSETFRWRNYQQACLYGTCSW